MINLRFNSLTRIRSFGAWGNKKRLRIKKNLPRSLPGGQIFLDYQTDSVVSREIIKKDTGTVTLFAFDKGQGLSEHTAPFDALVYIADGSLEIIISGKSNKVKAGEMIIMPAHKPHALKAIKRFKMLLVMIKTH